MFKDKRQQPNAKYGRDECISCMRRLGLGLDPIAKLLGASKPTIARIVQNRIATPRYEGFDKYRWAGKQPVRKPKSPPAIDYQKIYEKARMEELRQESNYWK